MEKLLRALSGVAGQAFKDFTGRGGVIRSGERVLTEEEFSSQRGVLVPVLWMLSEFMTDYEIDFPPIAYRPDGTAMTGVCIEHLDVNKSSSPSVFMLGDFLRNELLTDNVSDLDLSELLRNFAEWARTNVAGYDGQAPSVLSPDD